MIPYGTALEAEAALGRSMTWAEACWFRYSATMPDLFLTWHIGLVYFVMYALVPLPVVLLQQLAPAVAQRYKLQPGVPLQSPFSILRYLRENASLTLVIMGPFPLVYSAAFKVLEIRTGLPLPSIWETVTLLVVYSLVEDYMSYWLHRFLHTRWGYETIHCVHHEVRTPAGFGASATYAHGIELTLYIITIFTGPVIVPCHVTTHWIWFAIRVKSAMDAHSGYEFPFSPMKLIPFYGGPEFHDYHHYAGGQSRSNFSSVFTYCDYIYGTTKGYMHHKGIQEKIKTKQGEHNIKCKDEGSGKEH